MPASGTLMDIPTCDHMTCTETERTGTDTCSTFREVSAGSRCLGCTRAAHSQPSPMKWRLCPVLTGVSGRATAGEA